jgi:hypothetical protein
MLGPTFEDQEAWLQKTARELPYPETPDIASAVRLRLAAIPARPPRQLRQTLLRLTWAAAVLVAILLGLLAVPSVRAEISEFIQIGIVRVFLAPPTPTLPAVVPAVPGSTGGEDASASPDAVPSSIPEPTPTLLSWLLDLEGKATLQEAQQEVDFPIRQPSYPADLGEPDHVFLQDMDGPMIILVWMDPEQPNRIRLSLHMYGPGTFADKMQPRTVRMTQVNGKPAIWAIGPYILRLRNGDMDTRRLIDGHVLIWEQDSLTYRLETDLDLEEAVKIAESLK